MNVIACGTKVILAHSEYPGIITGINIRDERIVYEVGYWESGAYKSNWFCAYEFETLGEHKELMIGFATTSGTAP